jgi:hypothetical protein
VCVYNCNKIGGSDEDGTMNLRIYRRGGERWARE